jgi:hypothetical protein
MYFLGHALKEVLRNVMSTSDLSNNTGDDHYSIQTRNEQKKDCWVWSLAEEKVRNKENMIQRTVGPRSQLGCMSLTLTLTLEA